MGSELCKACIHTKVCMKDKNLVGDVPVMGHPMFFDNDKLYEEYKEREKQGFPCEDYMSSAQQWIPCSEQLPEVNGRYLVTRGLNACGSLWNRIYIANYSDLMGLKSERIWWNGNVGKSDFERIDDVIAWMPLPEPYNRADMRGEEDEQTAKEKTT